MLNESKENLLDAIKQTVEACERGICTENDLAHVVVGLCLKHINTGSIAIQVH